ncbi:MAG: hypothetical protein ACK5JU_01120 [Bacteroidales bacterium]
MRYRQLCVHTFLSTTPNSESPVQKKKKGVHLKMYSLFGLALQVGLEPTTP